MKKIVLSAVAVAALSFTQSCHNDFENDVTDIAVSSGEANFSKYIALGNSLTSGFRDNSLYLDGQNESYPSMIAQQMKLAGGGDFKQPLMSDNLGGIPSVGIANKLTLQLVNGALTPALAAGAGTTTLANIYSSGPYQNMGVPGAKSYHLVAPGYGSAAGLATGTANPYFVRFASSATTSVLADAMAQNPTFFSLWIGNNDVLGYATSGGDGSNPITSEAMFTQAYTALVTTLTSKGAKGVVANIPNVTSIPFFTTVPYNPVPLDAATATSLNQQVFGPLIKILTAYGQGSRLQLVSSTAANPLLIKDEALQDMSAQITGALVAAGVPAQQAGLMGKVFGQARHATSADMIPLSTRSVIGTAPTSPYAVAPFNKYGVTFPLEDKHILTATETKEVMDATAKFNSIIKAAADSKGLAFVDANAKMVELNSNSGIQFDGVKYTTKFVTGGSFSLDGVHLTGRGYGIIANEFIKAINAKYKSNLPQVNANSYSGITFPQ